MAILTDSGRTAVALSIKNQPIHLAWGSGSSGWDTTPVPESITDTALVAEIGRKIITVSNYVTPDVAGAIVVPTGRFSVSATPTRYLYCRFDYDYGDSSSATIRELGVFVGCTTNPALPGGQTYFAPSDIVSPGTMLVSERIPVFSRSPTSRPTFEFVIMF